MLQLFVNITTILILTFTIIIYRIVLLMAEGASTASSFLEVDPLKNVKLIIPRINYPDTDISLLI